MLVSQAWILSAYRFIWVNNVRFSDVLHSSLLHDFTPYSPPSMPMNITWIYFGEIILTPPIQPVQSGQSLSAHTHNPPLTDFFFLLMSISEGVYYSRCLIIFECVLLCVINCLCSVVTSNCTFAPRTFSSLVTIRKLISHFRQVLWSLWNDTSIQLTTQTHSEPHAAVSILLQRSLATPAKTSHWTL